MIKRDKIVLDMLDIHDIHLKDAWIERIDLSRCFLAMDDEWECWTNFYLWKNAYDKVTKLLQKLSK